MSSSEGGMEGEADGADGRRLARALRDAMLPGLNVVVRRECGTRDARSGGADEGELGASLTRATSLSNVDSDSQSSVTSNGGGVSVTALSGWTSLGLGTVRVDCSAGLLAAWAKGFKGSRSSFIWRSARVAVGG